jgi:hypothetical protein
MLPRKSESTSSTSIIHQQTQEDFLIEGLFQFIQKNTYIPQFLASIANDSAEAKALQAAINKGESNDPMFDHPDCYLYLLYLIKNKQIPFWQGITIYYYLSILMQFTSRQPLKSEDADLKLIRDNIFIDKMTDQGKLTLHGEKYLHDLCKKLKEIDCPIELKEVVEFVHQLPPCEQWLFRLPYTDARQADRNYDALTTTLVRGNTPFLVKTAWHILHSEFDFYWVPSSSVTNYILQKISPQPMLRQPVFGTVSTATLRQLHKNGIHPISLYAPHVKSNLREADSFRCGPTAIAVHDDAHTIWGSMLKPEERDYIFNYYLPQLDVLANALKNVNAAAYAAVLEVIRRTADLDLIGEVFNTAEIRFGKYLESRFLLTTKIDDSDYKAQIALLYYTYCMSLSVASSKFDSLVWQQNLLGYFNKNTNLLVHPEKLDDVLKNEKPLAFSIPLTEQTNLKYQLTEEKNPEEEKKWISSSSLPSKVFLSKPTTLDRQSANEKYFLNEEAVYYAVGLPIDIKEPIANMDTLSSLKKQIAPEDYWHSFNNASKLILFSDEYLANQYARATRVGDIYQDKICKQSPVFKVKLAPGLEQVEIVEGKIFIHERMERPEGGTRSENSMNSIPPSLQLKPNEVVLLEGAMEVSTLSGNNRYAPVDMKNRSKKSVGNLSQFFQQHRAVVGAAVVSSVVWLMRR